MTSYAYTVIDATGEELTGEISAPDLPAALEQLQLRELLATERVKPNSLQISLPQPTSVIEAGLNSAAWTIYAVLAVAIGSFLLAVLLMATGVVGTLHT